MSDYGWGMFKKGLKRRKKEVRRMRVMTCLAVFFLVFTLLLQDNLNAYRMQANYMNFGTWAVRARGDSFENESSLVPCGSIRRGSSLYRLYPGALEIDPLTDEPYGDSRFDVIPEEHIEIGFDNSYRNPTTLAIGTFTPEFARQQHIELYDGRWPEADNEIVMELYALEMLGESYELGKEISFYIAEHDDMVYIYSECERLYLEACEAWKKAHPGETPPEDPTGIGADGEDDYGDGVEPEAEDDGAEPAEYGEASEAVPDGDRYPERKDFTPERVFGTKKLNKVSFKLVGTMERYSVGWDNMTQCIVNGMDLNPDLPSAVITANRFDELAVDKVEVFFYELSPDLKKGRVWETAEELFTSFENSGKPDESLFVVNRSAFTNPLWGNAGMYRGMTVLLIVLSASIIAYLMASYLGKRRLFFMRMREIGATTFEVFSMAAYECVLSVLPTAFVSLAVSYIVGFFAAFIVGRATGVSFAFAFYPGTLLTILACIGCTLALSLAAALMIFAGRGITARRRILSRSAARSVKRRSRRMKRSKRAYLSLGETLVRDRRSHAFKTATLRLISIFVCAVILFCTFISAHWIKNYRSVCAYYCDVSAVVQGVFVRPTMRIPYKPNKWGKTPNEREGSSGACQTVRTVIPRAFAEELCSLPGVGKINWCLRDTGNVRLSWEGKEEDPFFNTVYKAFLESQNHNRDRWGELDLSEKGKRYMESREPAVYAVYGDSDPERLWKLFSKWLDPAVADKEKFLNGEQVIVMVDDEGVIIREGAGNYHTDTGFVLSDFPENPWDELGHSFEPGDTITYVIRDDVSIDLCIAGVVPSSKAREEISSLPNGNMRFKNHIMQLIGSTAFAEKAVELAKSDPEASFDALSEFTCYNSARIYLNEMSVNESTLKSISNICAKYNIEYANWVEDKELVRQEMLRTLATYGLFGAILAVLFFFVISSVQNDENARLADKIAILRRAGTERSSIVKQRMADAAKQTLWLVLSLPVFTLLSMNRQGLIKQVIAAGDDYIIFPNVLESIKSVIGPQVILPALAVLMLIYWLITSGALQREKK